MRIYILGIFLAFQFESARVFAKEAQPTLGAAALDRMDSILADLQQSYEAKDLKNLHFGFDLASAAQEAKLQINQADQDPNTTLSDYQKMITGFFIRAHDYHFNVKFANPEYSYLPLRIYHSEGRFFIGALDASIADDPNAKLHVGDEVITFGDRYIADAVEDLKPQLRHYSFEDTLQNIATQKLTYRLGMQLEPIEKGAVTIGVRSVTSRQLVTVTLNWIYVQPATTFVSANGNYGPPAGSLEDLIAPRNGPLPDFGQPLWHSAGIYFRAYITKIKDYRVGYIRVANYDGNAARVAEFAKLIETMENETDLLLLDQTFNPGGQGYYFHALESYLIDEPQPVGNARMALYPSFIKSTQQTLDIIEKSPTLAELIKNEGPDNSGYPVDMVWAADRAEGAKRLLNEAAAGLSLSSPLPRTIMHVQPALNGVRYHQPILLLANEQDFSNAELSLAQLQRIGRAKIFGSRTGGAVSYNDKVTFPATDPLRMLSYSRTMATMYDENNVLMEDKGIVPDYPYAIKPEDLMHNYADYAKALSAAISDILDP